MVTALIIDGYYADNTHFNQSAACFFISIFFLFMAKNADKPKKDGFGPRNSLRLYFEAKGALRQYGKLCNLTFVVLVFWGLVELVLGLVGI
jgi:hypothetical protein